MDRRSFLRSVAASVVIAGHFLPKSAMAKECSSSRFLGTQLFSVSDLLLEDARATLAALGELGFKNVELFGLNSQTTRNNNFFGLSAQELKRAVESSGLTMTYSHVEDNWEDTVSVARAAELLGLEALILGAAEEFYTLENGVFNPVPTTDLDQLNRLADRLNKAGEKYRQAGFVFGYHNHWTEFSTVAGKVPLDYLIENTGTRNFKLELDVAWLTVAGIDPASYLRRHADRVISCHLKDFDDRVKLPRTPTWSQYIESAIVEPGAGTIDFDPILDALAEIGIDHAFVEVDKSSDPLAAIDRGKRHLLALQGCP